MIDLVAGIDGGGSKTRVILSDADGNQLADVTGAGSAMAPGRADHCAEVIGGLLRQAVHEAEVGERRIKAIVAGVAGVGREAEARALTVALEDLELADEVIVQGDGEIALSDAFGSLAGIILIAGTGSIAYGRSPARVLARCGGWGPAFGDEGSGAWIGRKALGIVASAADGREPQTALTGAILTAAQVNEPAELIPWGIAATPRELAALAPVVFNVASAGDQRAVALVGFAVEELVLHIRALAVRLFGDDRAAIPVAFSGGLLHKGSYLRKRLEQRLKSAVPGAQVRPVDIIAARGAVKEALTRVASASSRATATT
ncbi:MAG TPA: BadF/BadG/BcrA/BcrD ATPase family protein [Gemmatimonadaceae bacterium]|nr:BadF/BadG/BcrA/BcrD ATPase family protein [Gemmatimonadaceae bacterium]